MPRARGGTSPSTRSPPMRISPALGRSRPAIIRSSVVLPHPDGPSSTKNSPSRMDRSTPSTAWKSPNRLLRPRSSTPTTIGPLPSPPSQQGSCRRLELDLHQRRQLALHGADTHLRGQALRDGAVRGREGRGAVEHDRPPRIRLRANYGGERDLPQEGDLEPLGGTACAA